LDQVKSTHPQVVTLCFKPQSRSLLHILLPSDPTRKRLSQHSVALAALVPFDLHAAASSQGFEKTTKRSKRGSAGMAQCGWLVGSRRFKQKGESGIRGRAQIFFWSPPGRALSCDKKHALRTCVIVSAQPSLTTALSLNLSRPPLHSTHTYLILPTTQHSPLHCLPLAPAS
jgi:hypothetical protein